MGRKKLGQIPSLTQAVVRELFAYDAETGVLTWRAFQNRSAMAGSRAGTRHKHGYITIKIRGKFYFAHRLIWLYVTGKMPVECLDHIDGDRNNNRFENLREATVRENAQNMGPKKNITGLTGVRKCGSRWQSQICHNYKKHYLGLFDTPEQAHEAYKAAKAKLHTFQPTLRALKGTK